MNIPQTAYLAYAQDFSQKERSWQTALMEWLPESITDVHAHANAREHVLKMSSRTRGHMLSTFPFFSIEESRIIRTQFFPNINNRIVRFAQVFGGVDHKAANDYLLKQSGVRDRVALYGLPDDETYTIKELQTQRYVALKMYPSYQEPSAQTIYEYFRPPLLEEAQSLGIPIILHPPRIITNCMEDLLRVLRDFPRLKVVLAHLGLTKMVVPGLRECYRELSHHQNLFTDTSMVPDADVVALAIQEFGTHRVLFGSDEPLYLIRARAYEHPTKGQRLITTYPYHWVDPQEQQQYGHLATGVTHALWPCLQAIRDAIGRLPKSEQSDAKSAIFNDNASACFPL
ncbi:amidohydrolase family protein [Candidatus Uhrbacteria bacterium]|nr:amidohydrolase family protein [Candidatus Uhrbacteria bacterium]